ncbi:hypothetical protein ACH437_21725 [Streptomyces xinghaiensis]|uniref:hypothetical protein n=1 Tax=Streptomyces xinghaiensis TaxID=1038928 RepID=UPI0037B5F6BE
MGRRRRVMHHSCEDETAYPVILQQLHTQGREQDRLEAALDMLSGALTAVADPLTPALRELTESDVGAALKAMPVKDRGHVLTPLGIDLNPHRVNTPLCRDVLVRLRRDPEAPRSRHSLRHLTEPVDTAMLAVFLPEDMRPQTAPEAPQWSHTLLRLCLWSRCTASVADTFIWRGALTQDWAVSGLSAEALTHVEQALRDVLACVPGDPAPAGAGEVTQTGALSAGEDQPSATGHGPNVSSGSTRPLAQALSPAHGGDDLSGLRRGLAALQQAVSDAREPVSRIAAAVVGSARPRDEDLSSVRRLAAAFDTVVAAFPVLGLPAPEASLESIEDAVQAAVDRASDEWTRTRLSSILRMQAERDSPAVSLLVRAQQETRQVLEEPAWDAALRARAEAMTSLTDLVGLNSGEVDPRKVFAAQGRWRSAMPDLVHLALLADHISMCPAAEFEPEPEPEPESESDSGSEGETGTGTRAGEHHEHGDALPEPVPPEAEPADSSCGSSGGVVRAAEGPAADAEEAVASHRLPPEPEEVAVAPGEAPHETWNPPATVRSSALAGQLRGEAVTEEAEEQLGENAAPAGESRERTVTVWSDGVDSPFSMLIGKGALAEAYWLTRASEEPRRRSQVLAFIAAAFGVHTETTASAVLMSHDQFAADFASDREAQLIALVAALRCGLTAGWPSALVTDFGGMPGLPERWQALVLALVSAVRECRRLEPGSMNLDATPRVDQGRAEVGALARQLLVELPQRKTKYQRGTRVLQRLAAGDGALGSTLMRIVDWSEGKSEAAALQEEAERYRRSDAGARMIEEADRARRTPKQAKEEIQAGALRQLQSAVAQVEDLLGRACSLAAATGQQSLAPRADRELATVVRAVLTEPVPPGPGGAALHLLVRWLRGDLPAHLGGVGTSPDEEPRGEDLGEDEGTERGTLALPTPSTDCLLVVPDLPRDDMGKPDLASPEFGHRLWALTTPPQPEQCVAAYCERGELHLADDLVRALAEDVLPAVAPLPEATLSRMRQEVDDASARWGEQLRTKHREVGSLLAHVRALNLLDPAAEHEFTGRLQDLVPADLLGNHRAAWRELEEMKSRLSTIVKRRTAELRGELENLRLEDADRDRIATLLADGDTVTAGEFLSFAQRGKALPEHPGEVAGELTAFIRGLSGARAPRPKGQGVSAQWWADQYAAGKPLTEGAKNGLQAWYSLCNPVRRSGEWQKYVPQVLRLLGLECQSADLRESERPTRGVLRLRARASVSEAAPGYIAALGSRAASYTVLLISEEQRGDGPLVHLEEADLSANIVIYLHPLGMDGRSRLARASRGRPQQALVVDPAVYGWMAARAPRSFRALQQVTLPWSGYNPYTPYVAGLVPPEVFYGRNEQMRDVMERDAGLFVYGGRQLGKSALLRRVAGIFPQHNPDHVALYVDLLKAEIGQAEPPERIWNVIAGLLKEQKVLGPRVSERASPKVIGDHIRTWLRENPDRRLLVLADEADAFLTADSRPDYTRGGQSTFPTFTKLQQLMEDTGRRFKVIFAGLHQVQRFQELQNVVVVHGGPGILVGPLTPEAAVRLVVEPMAALGYVFEQSEVVWRVLAITNYQANLIQIFCSELVKAMHARPMGAGGVPPVVTEQDVQGVAGSDLVRQRIAERLRFTINLEDRYRVLALIIALESLEKGYSTSYSPEELLDRAREVWPEGFDRLGGGQIRIYLEEMEGLGLLIQLPAQRRFAVRSPNVVNMLGTREELKAELKETEFGLPYDYNPRASRRLIGPDSHGVLRYSPLTEGQLHEAVHRGVTVVAASELFQPQLILRAAKAYAEGRDIRVLEYRPGVDLTRLLAEASRQRSHFVLADLREADARDLRETVNRLVTHIGVKDLETMSGRKTDGRNAVSRSALVVTRPDAVPVSPDLRVPVVRPDRWTADSLRSWPECPFGSLDERRRLISATGGWPHLVERAITTVRNGATLEAGLRIIRDATATTKAAGAHIERSGLDAGLVGLLAAWSGYLDEGVEVDTSEVAAGMEIGLAEAEEYLAQLADFGILDQSEQGVALDPVTFRAVQACGAGE